MRYKDSFFRLLKIGFVLLLVYLVIGVCHFFVFSDKLTYDELVVVTEYYEEIRPVETSIKSDFYVDTLLKVLDKEYILEELRKDSLTYSIHVINESFKMFTEDLSTAAASNYVRRCYLDFNNFVGLDNTIELFELITSFYADSTQEVEDLEIFAKFMDEIVSHEYYYLNGVDAERDTNFKIVVSSYFVLLVLFYCIDMNKISGFVKNNIKSLEKKNKSGDKK